MRTKKTRNLRLANGYGESAIDESRLAEIVFLAFFFDMQGKITSAEAEKKTV